MNNIESDSIIKHIYCCNDYNISSPFNTDSSFQTANFVTYSFNSNLPEEDELSSNHIIPEHYIIKRPDNNTIQEGKSSTDDKTKPKINNNKKNDIPQIQKTYNTPVIYNFEKIKNLFNDVHEENFAEINQIFEENRVYIKELINELINEIFKIKRKNPLSIIDENYEIFGKLI